MPCEHELECAVEIKSRLIFESSDFYVFEICVGNNNPFEYGGPRAPSARFSSITNINFSKQKLLRFECDTGLYSLSTLEELLHPSSS